MCYLVVRHFKDVTEASSTDVICNFIGDLKWVLEWGSSYCGYIWAGNKVYQICLVLSQNVKTGASVQKRYLQKCI